MRISDWSSDVCSSDLAGAKEYIPLPPDAELIAAVLAAVADDGHSFIFKDPKMTEMIRLADQVAPSDASIQLGRASCRERVGQYVSISVVAVSFKKKHQQQALLQHYM